VTIDEMREWLADSANLCAADGLPDEAERYRKVRDELDRLRAENARLKADPYVCLRCAMAIEDAGMARNNSGRDVLGNLTVNA